jgi:hypothetical protein
MNADPLLLLREGQECNQVAFPRWNQARKYPSTCNTWRTECIDSEGNECNPFWILRLSKEEFVGASAFSSVIYSPLFKLEC